MAVAACGLALAACGLALASATQAPSRKRRRKGAILSPTIHVVTAGWATRVVDLGRPRTRSLGVPVGGAADRASLMLGNALLGNPPDAAALEVSVLGPTLRAEGHLAGVVLGAPFELTSSCQQVRPGVTFTWHDGEEVRIAGTPLGLRAYVCVQGSLQMPSILGSRSGLDVLPAGGALPVPSVSAKPQATQVGGRFLPPGVFESWNETGPLRVVPGLQASWFTTMPTHDAAGTVADVSGSEGFRQFLGQEFTVSPLSDRMGLRLQGEPLPVPARELTSEPVCPGSVQVTSDGQCIVLGVDGQTIGGYPKIAQVIAADLDRLGQLRPGQRLSFALVELNEAMELYRQRERALAEWLCRLAAMW